MGWYMRNILIGAATKNFPQTVITPIGLVIAGMALAGSLNAASLNHVDVIVADSQATVYAFNPQTGQSAIIAQQDKLDRPYDLARKSDGNILVSDTGTLRIVQVNPLTSEQTVVAEGGALGVPYGLDVDPQNRIYVANSSSIVTIAPGSGIAETFAQGDLLQVPLDVAVGPDGNLYVADALAGVIRIDPLTKQQTRLVQPGVLRTPTSITTDGKRTAYVVDGTGRCVVAVDLLTGKSKPVATAGLLTTPVGIALAPGGTMLVSDPDTCNLDGAIIMIGQDGTQTVVARGSGDLVNARGILIVPDFLSGR
jgi:streptogramin lyase